MWLEYIRERCPEKSVLEYEGAGFAIYYPFEAENAMYIEDIFVVKDKRSTKLASRMEDEIMHIAHRKGLKYMIGSCDPATRGATHSMKTMLTRGYEIYQMVDGLIYMRKEV